MPSTPERNPTPSEAQVMRLRKLRVWMILHGVTWPKFGEVMGGISGNGAQKSLRGERMPENHHAALLRAYPDLSADLLPRPEDVKFGPKPKVPHFPGLSGA